ncbi:hypothetical protein ACJ41O_000177 [Fusarium nematophilum]
MTSIRPYTTICVPESKIQDLKERLRLAKFLPTLALTDSWAYGAPVSDVKRLAARWHDGYDWRAAEAKLDNYPWQNDEILTWISIFQFSTAGPEASARIYYEMEHPEPLTRHLDWVPDVKLGLSYFPRDVMVLPRCYGRTLGRVVFEKVNEHGGHFAAHGAAGGFGWGREGHVR